MADDVSEAYRRRLAPNIEIAPSSHICPYNAADFLKEVLDEPLPIACRRGDAEINARGRIVALLNIA